MTVFFGGGGGGGVGIMTFLDANINNSKSYTKNGKPVNIVQVLILNLIYLVFIKKHCAFISIIAEIVGPLL